MPRDIRTFTTCAGPGIAKSHRQLGGLTGLILSALYENKWLTVTLLLGFYSSFVILQSNLAYAAFIIYLIVELDVRVKGWYYHQRLLCIRDKECAIGTVIAAPSLSFDGDRKLNLLLAPYSHKESLSALLLHFIANFSMLTDPGNFNDPPFHTTNPRLPSQTERNDPQKLKAYLKALKGEDPGNSDVDSRMYSQFLIGFIDRLLGWRNQAGEKMNFYQRFFRKDPDHIPPGSSLWKAIPEDYDPSVSWLSLDAQSDLLQVNPYEKGTASSVESLNPMFRFDIEHLVPYLHCEIDGNAIEVLIEQLIIALWATLIAYFFLLPSLGPLAPILAPLFGFFVFLFKRVFDDLSGNSGDAEEPELDWDDPDFTGFPGLTGERGDVIAVYGAWIMDTQHNQYFEIHPVRAFYILSKNAMGNDILTDENVGPNYDPTKVDASLATQACAEITPVEEEDPPVDIVLQGHALLSYGMGTQYAGGGAAAPII